MPRLRALIASVAGGLLVFAVIGFWLRWPMYLSVTLAALLGVVFLMMAAALDDEGEAADAAWRTAAADLLGGDPAGTAPAEPADPAAATDPAGESTSAPDTGAEDEPAETHGPGWGHEPEAGPVPATEPVPSALRVENQAEP